MVCRGLGFAWLPMTRIGALLDSGQLRELALERGGHRPSTLYLTLADTAGIGPATQRLSALLAQTLSDHT